MSKLVPKSEKIAGDDKVHLPVMKHADTTAIRLSGTAITTTGSLTKHDYFSFLEIDFDDYSDIEFTPDEAKKVAAHMRKMKTGHTAMVPMICSPKCPFRQRCIFFQLGKAPFGRACQPCGEKVLTLEEGYINIENLDPNIHSLPGYEKRRNAIRRGMKQDKIGFNFKKAYRDYDGDLVVINTESGKSYKATHDHICIARFNDNAEGKFAVYLMRRGNAWRVGKTTVLKDTKRTANDIHKKEIKRNLSFGGRSAREDADEMWLLNVYDTNAEAMLGEDFYSCEFQTSKTLFISPKNKRKKENGLYAWTSQEQLDKHHEKFLKPLCFYADKLEKLGLDINYPIWTKQNSDKSYLDPSGQKVLAKGIMYIRACNLISGIMDVPTIPDQEMVTKVGNHTYRLADWETLKVTREKYQGTVYSLDVEGYNTYFTNGIATHNCLIETNLIREWTINYFNEYNVDPNNFTEVGLISELSEIEVYLWRLSQTLAKPENAELIEENVVGFSGDGQPLTTKQLSSALQAKESLYARKAKLIKLMVGDRQEKYKREAALKTRDDSDPSSSMADLKGNLLKLMRKIEKQSNIIDVEAIETKPVAISAEDLINGDDD